MTEFELLEAARAARRNAYAPYSHFHVGAAVLAEDGKVYLGCNMENAAYPEGVCAEGGALTAMVVAGARKVGMIALSAGPQGETHAVLPCGGCRQKLYEFATADTVVVLDAPGGAQRHALADLLPKAFGPADL